MDEEFAEDLLANIESMAENMENIQNILEDIQEMMSREADVSQSAESNEDYRKLDYFRVIADSPNLSAELRSAANRALLKIIDKLA